MGYVQKTYTRKSDAAAPGLMADIDAANRVLTFTAEGDVEFGYGVFRGTLPEEQAKVSGNGPTAGYIVDTSTWPIADQVGLTFTIVRKGETGKLITFAGAVTTVAHAVAEINTQYGDAVLAADDGAGALKITDLRTGKETGISITAGTSAITWDTPVNGTDTNFLGVALRDHFVSEGYLGKYGDERNMGVIVEGPVWIELETTGAIGDPLTVNKTTGRIGTNAVGGNYVAINAVLDSAATATGQLVRIKLLANA